MTDRFPDVRYIYPGIYFPSLSPFPPFFLRAYIAIAMDFQRTILTLELAGEHRRGKRRRSKGSGLFQAGSTPSRVSALLPLLSSPGETALLRTWAKPSTAESDCREKFPSPAKSAVYPRELSDSRMNASNYTE